MSTVTDETTAAPARARRLSTTDLALVAAFAALIAVCSYVAAIPISSGVPITLQTFAVLLAGLVLGPVRGFLAVGLYLLLGLIGLPVFAEHTSGAAVFNGPTGGYLYSFLAAALVAGLLVKYVAGARRTRAVFVLMAAVVGVVVNHLGGIIGLHVVLGTDWQGAATIDAPFWVGDLVKAAVAAIVAAEVHRAFPQLLRRG
jgi:biotin transport system substrate-specific component